jgi:hypothetical protein
LSDDLEKDKPAAPSPVAPPPANKMASPPVCKPRKRLSKADVKRWAQWPFDRFYYAREGFGNALVFLSLRLMAVEVTWKDVEDKSLTPTREDGPLDLTDAKDVDTLLDVAKDAFKTASDRRASVIDKTKTLLTLGSLFLALVGFLLPKDLAYSTDWQKALVVATVLLFLHAIVLLLLFFTVGKEMTVCLDQDTVGMEETELKRCLAISYLESRSANDRRTDYLVEVFKAARFAIFAAFVTASTLFGSTFLFQAPGDQATKFIQKLRGDAGLTELLKGPKGDVGTPGAKGLQGLPGKDAHVDLKALAKQVTEELKKPD